MFKILLASLIALPSIAAEPLYTQAPPPKVITKADAIRALLADKNAQIFKCQPVELTDKVTLRNK